MLSDSRGPILPPRAEPSELELAKERTKLAKEETKQARIRFHTIGMTATTVMLGLIYAVALLVDRSDHHLLQWLGGSLLAIGFAARWLAFGGSDD